MQQSTTKHKLRINNSYNQSLYYIMNIIPILSYSYKTILLLLIIGSLIGIANAKTFDTPIKKINHQSKYHIQIINFDTISKNIPQAHANKIIHSGKAVKHGSGSAAKTSAPTSREHNIDGGSPSDQNIVIPSDVVLSNFHFDQQQLNIHKGDLLNWINRDTIDHFIQIYRVIPGSLLHEPFSSKYLSPFDTLPVQFNQPGRYVFQCLSPNHNSMQGTIFVS
jgi:plastocyanin